MKQLDAIDRAMLEAYRQAGEYGLTTYEVEGILGPKVNIEKDEFARLSPAEQKEIADELMARFAA